jgi:hypothetical protein
MHYFCGGVGSRELAITDLDRVGVSLRVVRDLEPGVIIARLLQNFAQLGGQP